MSAARWAGNWICAALVLGALVGPAVVQADESDHERARRALEAGEILPLARILERVERDYPGRVVEVELEREHGGWRYEVKLLQAGGRVLKLEVDAEDAGVLSVKGRERAEARRDGRAR